VKLSTRLQLVPRLTMGEALPLLPVYNYMVCRETNSYGYVCIHVLYIRYLCVCVCVCVYTGLCQCHGVTSRVARVVGMLLNLDGGPRSTRSSQECTSFLLQIRQRNVGFATVRRGKRLILGGDLKQRRTLCEAYEGRFHKVVRNTPTPICFRWARLIPVTGGASLWRYVGSLMQK